MMQMQKEGEEVMQKNPVSLYVVEDHPVVREGMVALLQSHPSIRLLGACGNANQALEELRRLRPDVVVLDLDLGGNDSLVMLRTLVAEMASVKVLVFSMLNEAVFAERAIRAGAVGYVMKSSETEELFNAIRMVSENRIYLSPKIFVSVFRSLLKRTPASPFAGIELLSDRELQVFQLIGAELSNSEIAARLSISTKTVEAHRENLKRKLKLTSATELLKAAKEFVADVYANTP